MKFTLSILGGLIIGSLIGETVYRVGVRRYTKRWGFK
jgi:hypothetical protein